MEPPAGETTTPAATARKTEFVEAFQSDFAVSSPIWKSSSLCPPALDEGRLAIVTDGSCKKADYASTANFEQRLVVDPAVPA
jgi:hypothetical protein